MIPSYMKILSLAGVSFDTSVPQGMMEDLYKAFTARGVKYRPQLVWYYAPGAVFGEALPLDETTNYILSDAFGYANTDFEEKIVQAIKGERVS